MAEKKDDDQNSYLSYIQHQNKKVRLYLVNGIKLEGYITGFDNFVIFLEIEGTNNLIFKHALTTLEIINKK